MRIRHEAVVAVAGRAEYFVDLLAKLLLLLVQVLFVVRQEPGKKEEQLTNAGCDMVCLTFG